MFKGQGVLNIPTHYHRYPGPMVAACPVYAQTNKADSHAENEHYASADYHYVSNRGIKVYYVMIVDL